jgi:multidrug efflux pump subunit AcrA (membrane-fusion protein)
MQVALVGDDNKVQLRPVKVGRDYGNTIEILNGIKATDRVIINPPDSIADGMKVQIAPATEDKAKQ